MNNIRTPNQEEIDSFNRRMHPATPLIEDIYFLCQCLPLTDSATRDRLITEYRNEWLLGMSQHSIEHARQNAGRRRANDWLRVGATPKGKDGELT